MTVQLKDFSQLIHLKNAVDQERRSKKIEEEGVEVKTKLSKKEWQKEVTEAFIGGSKEKVIDLIGQEPKWYSFKVLGQNVFTGIMNDPEWAQMLFNRYPPGQQPNRWPHPHLHSVDLFNRLPMEAMRQWIQQDPQFIPGLLENMPAYETNKCLQLSNVGWFKELIFKSQESRVVASTQNLSVVWKGVLDHPHLDGLVHLEALKVNQAEREQLKQVNQLWKFTTPEKIGHLLLSFNNWDAVASIALPDASASDWLMKACAHFFDSTVHNKMRWVLIRAQAKDFQTPDSVAQKYLGLSKEILELTPVERFMAAYIVYKHPHVEEGATHVGDVELSKAMVEQIKLLKWAKEVFEGPSWRALIGYMQRWGSDFKWHIDASLTIKDRVFLSRVWPSEEEEAKNKRLFDLGDTARHYLDRAAQAKQGKWHHQDYLLGPGSASRLLGLEELRKACKVKKINLDQIIKDLSPKGVALHEKRVLQKTFKKTDAKVSNKPKKRL